MANDTVTVACNLPNGLQLDLPNGETVKLNGSNTQDLVNGFGITENVPKAFWDEWTKLFKDFPPLKRGLIFARAKEADVKAQTAEHQGEKTGMERIDPNKPAPGVERDLRPGEKATPIPAPATTK